eukprot:scaffold137843_cov31-Attheya_sp.AAC.1
MGSVDADSSCGSNAGQSGGRLGLFAFRLAQSMRLGLAVGMLVDLLQSEIWLQSYPLNLCRGFQFMWV